MQDAFTELVSDEVAEPDAVDPRRPPASSAAPRSGASARVAGGTDRAADAIVEDGGHDEVEDLVDGSVAESTSAGGGDDSSRDGSNDVPPDPPAADAADPGRDGLADDLMIRATDTPSSDVPPPAPGGGADTAALPQLRGKHVCPFCGTVRELEPDHSPAAPCPKCTMSDSPQTRQATKARIGPWFVRQTRNPAAPGMKFETLLSLVKRGQVASHSVVRGPTTHQLWRFAANVKGLSREFGLCYSCAATIDRTANLCPHCNRLQEPPANPDLLLETTGSAATAPAAAAPALPVQRELKSHPSPKPVSVAPPPPAKPPSAKPARPATPAAVAAVAPTPLTTTPPAPVTAPPAPVPVTAAKGEPTTTPSAPAGPARPKDTSPPPLHASFERPADGTMASVLQAATVATPSRSRDDAGPVALNPESSPAPRDARRAPRREPRAQQQQQQPRHEPAGDGDGAARPDMLLTAEELAAAFQLDFKPAAAAARARHQTGAAVRRRRLPIGKLIAALLLLAVGGGAVALAVLPDFRRDTFNWAQDTYASLRETVDGNAAPPAGTRTTAADSSAPSPAPNSAASSTPIEPVPSGTSATGARAARPASPPPVEPATKPVQPPAPPQTVAAAIPPTIVTPVPPVVVTPKTEPKAPPPPPEPDPVRDAVARPIEPIASAPDKQDPPPPAAKVEPLKAEPAQPQPAKPQPSQPEPPKPAPAAPAAKPMDPALAYDRAIVLWRQALDAEQAGNYTEAVRTYEELQKLPKEVWPGGLEINLKIARRRLGRDG